MRNIFAQYGFDEKDCMITPFGNGLINNTWLLEVKAEQFILQKINQQVFKSPLDIAFNIRLIAGYLHQHHPDYLFVSPLQTIDANDMASSVEGYFRIFPFVKGAHTIDVAERPEQAYEAAKQFGRFTKSLSGLDPAQLKITLPDFHNLTLRYQQFEQALWNGNKERIRQSKDLIEFISRQKTIVGEFEFCRTDFKTRCTHHDTKISNVLFDENEKGLCVIDLDTVMPGYFISDVGDMLRTYLSPVSEEEKDFSKITIRKEFYNAIVKGYYDEMKDELSGTEKEQFLFAGKFMIYLQAIRFLTDHINNDIYYGSKYEGQNFVRAGNQVTLLQKLIDFKRALF
jgi:Ser/Thr protein kinase RdoA (MazF antagonist)